MKRKLAIFGLCFAGAELFAANMPPLVLVPAAALLLLLLFLGLTRRSKGLPLAAGLLAGLCWFAGFSFLMFRPVRALAGQTVTCTVTVEPDAVAAYQSGQLRGTLTVTEADGKACRFKLRSNGFPAQEAGERFTAVFALRELPRDAYRASRLSKGILLQGEYQGGYKTAADSHAVRFVLYRLRQRASALVRRWLPRDLGGLEAAMLLGDRAALLDAVQDTFRAAGISHLLAVSGLHLTLLCGLFSFGRRRRFCRPLILARAAVAVFYMLLTGLPVSVLRAGIVFLLVLLGDWFYQPIDLLTLTGAAAILLGLQNPYAPCDVGFQLSFCAVLGVQAAAALAHWEEAHCPGQDAEGISACLRRGALALLKILQTAALASLTTLPVLVAQGLTTSGVGVLANLLTVWMLQPALMLGLVVLALQLAALLVPLVAPLAHMASFLLAVWLRIFYGLASWCAALPLAHLSLPRSYTLLVLALLGTLALAYYAAGKFRWYAPVAALCTGTAIVLGVQMQKNVVTLALVGTAGNPSVVCTQNSQAVVLFRGGETNLRAVRSYLADHGAAEQVLTVDLRRSGTDLDFDTAEVLTVQEQDAYTAMQILNNLTLDLYHTSSGNLAVVGDGRFHVAVMAGNVTLAQPVAVDALCAAGALSDSVDPVAILYTSSAPRWLDQVGTSRLYYGQDTPFIQLRPGRSLQIKEAERIALQ